jgi:mannose-6-phosphate isomerase-like protein (cupin superfamily)
MTDPTRDPVHKARYAFAPQGDDLVVHCWVEPGGALPAHLHPRQTESWSVVEGRVRFRLGDETRVIGPEDGEIVVAPGTKHALAAVDDREARLRCVVVPALHLQPFLEESAAGARDGMFLRRGVPRGLRGARWAARLLKRHRAETVFLSPPPIVQRVLITLLARDDQR